MCQADLAAWKKLAGTGSFRVLVRLYGSSFSLSFSMQFLMIDASRSLTSSQPQSTATHSADRQSSELKVTATQARREGPAVKSPGDIFTGTTVLLNTKKSPALQLYIYRGPSRKK